MGPEARLEARCVKLAEGAGWATVKIYAAPGWPDRFFFGPFGETVIIEFKAPRGRTRALQDKVIGWLALNEHDVHVVKTEEQFKEALSEALDTQTVPDQSRAAPDRQRGRRTLPRTGARQDELHARRP